jgi:hypothetical protein
MAVCRRIKKSHFDRSERDQRAHKLCNDVRNVSVSLSVPNGLATRDAKGWTGSISGEAQLLELGRVLGGGHL